MTHLINRPLILFSHIPASAVNGMANGNWSGQQQKRGRNAWSFPNSFRKIGLQRGISLPAMSTDAPVITAGFYGGLDWLQ